MKPESVALFIGVAGIAYLLLTAKWARGSGSEPATTTGGTYDGVFIGDLLNKQYAEGWGYGD